MGDFSLEFVMYLSKAYSGFISVMLFALALNILISATLFTLSFGSIFVTQKLKSKSEKGNACRAINMENFKSEHK